MQKQEIIDELIRLIKQSHEVDRALEGRTALIADLGLESIQVIEYLCDVEDRFDLNINEDKLADVNTFDDLASVILALQES
ncbi:MAG: acyl carrier protein [Gammaproteobacteria bacterium]